MKNLTKFIETFQHIFLSKIMELIIFPTEECNFRCIYCYEKFRKIYIYPYVIEGILNFIKSEKPESLYVSFFGGEPLLGFRYIQKIIEKIKSINIDFNGAITTNGFLLSKNYFSYLIENNISSFQITIDGGKEYHNKQRNLATTKIDTFSIIYNNIKNTKYFDKDFKITIRVNVTKENYHSVYDLIDYLSLDFSNDERYSILLYPVKDWGGYGSENIKNKKIELITTKDLFEIYKYCKTKGLAIYDGLSKKYGSICYAGKPYSFVIRSDGRIQKCTIALEDDVNTIGFIKPDGSIYIDQEKHSRWYSINALNTDKCKKCSFIDNCFGLTCPLQTIKNNTVVCCDYKTYYPFYKNLAI